MRGSRPNIGAVLAAALVAAAAGCGGGHAAPDAPVQQGTVDAAVDAPARVDARPADAAPRDAAALDGAPGDARPGDAGPQDAQPGDAQPADAAAVDASALDASPPPDAGPDAAPPPDALPDADPGPPPPLTTGLSTLAGTGVAADVDGSRDVARFSNPANLVVAPDGSVYVADFDNSAIRHVAADGTTSTVPVTTVKMFQRPFGIAITSDGATLYVETDFDAEGGRNGALWSISTATGAATLLIDNAERPRGIAVLPDGRLVLSDERTEVLSIYDPGTKTKTLLAGDGSPGYVDATGGAAEFNAPYDVVVLSSSAVAVADRGNNVIREVSIPGGAVTTLAGNGTAAEVDAAALSASFNQPQGLAVDAAGNLYITDLGGDVVRELSGGQVTTIAGDGIAGYLDSLDPLQGQLFGLEGVDVTSDGKLLYIADGNRGTPDPFDRIRRLTLP